MPDNETLASDFLGQEADLTPPPLASNNGAGVTGGTDLNDLNLQTEAVDIDPDADSTAAPPPIPDGIYEFNLLPIDKASFGKDRAQWGAGREKFPEGHEKAGQVNPQGAIKWMWSQAEYEAVEPGQPFDKQRVFENYVSTMVGRSGTSRVATLLKALGVSVPKRATHLQYVTMLIDASQKRPAIALETEWEARCGDCAKARKKDYRPAKVGMRFFPELSPGKHDPVVECQYCGNQVTARPSVAHYHASKRGQAKAAAAFDATI